MVNSSYGGPYCYLEKLSKLDNRLLGRAVDLDTIIQKYRLAIEKAIKETELIQGSPLSKEARWSWRREEKDSDRYLF